MLKNLHVGSTTNVVATRLGSSTNSPPGSPGATIPGSPNAQAYAHNVP